MIEGSGSRYGSIPLTNGSGSKRPKNMWIRWIRDPSKKNVCVNIITQLCISATTVPCSDFSSVKKPDGFKYV